VLTGKSAEMKQYNVNIMTISDTTKRYSRMVHLLCVGHSPVHAVNSCRFIETVH